MTAGWLGLCLFPEIKLKVVQHFLKNPELRQNQTQLARSLKLPQNSVGRHISDLVALRVLNEERYGKSAVYSLNVASIVVNKLLKEVMTLERNLLPSWVSEQMSALPRTAKAKVKKIILFGSAVRGELQPTSDIDLLAVISHRDPAVEFELNSALVVGGSHVGLSVNLQIETSEQFDSSISDNYLKNVKSEGIVLWTRETHARD